MLYYISYKISYKLFYNFRYSAAEISVMSTGYLAFCFVLLLTAYKTTCKPVLKQSLVTS